MPTQFSQTIKEKIAILKRLDPNYKVFGANSHQYKFNQVVDLKDIVLFEKKYHCKLPESYKDFLVNVGNGGVGPSYGVFLLGKMDDGFNLSAWTDDFVAPHKPFPFKEAFNDTSMLEEGMPDEAEFDDIDDYETAYNKWSDEKMGQLQIEYWDLHALDGAIPIVEHGCACRSWLVVAEGIEYGYIWQDDTADEGGVFPFESRNKERYTFDEWYLQWLENSIKIKN